MRIKILLSPTNEELPIQSQQIVNSFIHRLLGRGNKYHDAKNNYSISSLQGGKWISGTDKISFKNGGYIAISSLDNSFLDDILARLYTTPFYNDIKVCGIEFVDEKFYNGWNHFLTLSPFIIKEYSSKSKYDFITIRDDNFEEKIKDYLIKKITKIKPGLDLSDFDVKIENKHKVKTKKILIKNVINYANQCQISIHCNKKIAELIYNIGIGQSTGSGFGSLYKTENHKLYR